MQAAQMLHRIAHAVGWQGGARGPQDSQPLVSAGVGAESESTHRQWTEQEARPRAPRVRIPVPTEPPITEPEDDEFDEESAGAAGGRGDVRMHEHVGGDDASTGQGMGAGIAIGVALGVAFMPVMGPAGLAVGIACGVAFGVAFQQQRVEDADTPDGDASEDEA